MRVFPVQPPFRERSPYRADQPWHAVADWPASWIVPPAIWAKPWVAAFRCRFTLPETTADRLHVTADERYELILDGTPQGRGPERGDRSRWYYETYSLNLAPGPHVLEARVWALGTMAPWAQVSIEPGFFAAPRLPT